MCTAKELLKARREIERLKGDNTHLSDVIDGIEKQLQELQPPVIVPVTDLTWISRAEYLAEMKKVGIKPIDLGTPLDSIITITSEIELERIAPFLVYPAEWYIDQIWDCENYTLEGMNDAARHYHVNGITLALGNMPQGYHGFLVTLSKVGNIWLLENNAGFIDSAGTPYAGEWFRIGDYGYRPDKVFI